MKRYAVALFLVGCSSSDPSPVATGDAGSATPSPTTTSDPGTTVVPEAGLSCTGIGASCDETNLCCNGSTCVYDTSDPSKSVCATNCLDGTQCNTGCCAVLVAGTSAVCAPQLYCETSCNPPGQQCSSATCCANSICVNSTVTGVSCAARCATGSQCASGCCAPLNNTGERVCSPTNFCQ